MTKTGNPVSMAHPRMDWEDVRVFSAVVETGSVSAAARQLGTTHSTVSKRLDALEARLKAKLVNRSTAGVTLTSAGADVRDKALTMQRAADEMARLAWGNDKKPEGKVTISAPDGVAAFWIAPFLAEFAEQHPEIQVNLDCGLWPQNPIGDPPDITLSVDQNSRRLDETWSELGVLHYMLFAAPSYIEKYGMPASSAAVAEHRMLTHTGQSYQRDSWNPHVKALKLLVRANLVTNSSSAFVFALQHGMGIGPAPTFYKSFAPELVVVGKVTTPIQLWLVHHREAAKIARVSATLRWLKAIFDHKLYPWFRNELVHPDDFGTALEPVRNRLKAASVR